MEIGLTTFRFTGLEILIAEEENSGFCQKTQEIF